VIISAYSVISLGFQMPVVKSVFFLSMMHDTILFLIVYTTGMAGLYAASKAGQESLRNDLAKGNSKSFRQFVVSLPSLKCNIGGKNFVDELTPLVMLDFCINQTLALLLVN